MRENTNGFDGNDFAKVCEFIGCFKCFSFSIIIWVLKIVLGNFNLIVCILGRFQMMRMMMKDFQIPVLEVRMTSQTLTVLSKAC